MVDVAVCATPKPSSAPSPLRPVMRLGTAAVGPQQWQDDTVRSLKLGRSLNKKTEKEREYGRQHDTLPLLRDVLARQTNTVAFGYVREVRVVVLKLRENLINTNEEVKLLVKAKEALEKTLDFLRKDIIMNKKCVDIRKTRPKREKDLDEADKWIELERVELENQKRNLEGHLKKVKKHLILLDQSRKRLAKVLDERNQVLDLICHSRNSIRHDHLLKSQLLGPDYAYRPNTTALSGMATPKADSFRINKPMEILAKTANVSDEYNRDMFAAERGDKSALMRSGVYTARTYRPLDGERPSTPPVAHLGPYTPEAAEAIDETRHLIGQSRDMRTDTAIAIDTAEKEEKRLHDSVNDSLTTRLAETVTLMQHLNMGEAENRMAFNKNARHYELTDVSRGYNLGPVAYGDLQTRERLDRPMVKVYHRHPGTNVPDARELIRANNTLETSLENTQKNLALLHLSNIRIKDDQKDKKAAADIDASIIRFRKKKADHRWVPEQ